MKCFVFSLFPKHCKGVKSSMNSKINTIAAGFSPALISEMDSLRYTLSLIRPSLECPACGCSFDGKQKERLYADMSVTCACGRKSSARSGTCIDGVHAGWSEILMLCVLKFWGATDSQIAEKCSMSVDTVKRIIKRIS